MVIYALCGSYFYKKNSCLVARIVSFDTAGVHLLTLRILEPYLSKDILSLISVTQPHINDVIIEPSN